MAKSSLLKELEELEKAPKSPTGFPCRMSMIYHAIGSEDATAIESALINRKVNAQKIVQLLKAHGHEVGYATVVKHRRRADGTGCKCPIEN